MYRLERISEYLEENITLTLAGTGGDDDRDTKDLEKLADTLAKRIRLLSAYLQIHPEATQGKSREQVKQNQQHKEATEYSAGEGDGLIPGLTVQ